MRSRARITTDVCGFYGYYAILPSNVRSFNISKGVSTMRYNMNIPI